MSSPLPSSTLADRLAGLSDEVSLEAEEAWRLKRLWLETLARILAMLAGLATQFAAGTLPAPPPQAARSAPVAPTHPGIKAPVARRPGRARDGAASIQDGFYMAVPPAGTFAPSRATPATARLYCYVIKTNRILIKQINQIRSRPSRGFPRNASIASFLMVGLRRP